MPVPFWGGDQPEEAGWNFVWLGDAFLPGIARVKCTKSRSVDVKKQKGSDGAELEDTGYEPAKITIELKITNEDEWAAWQEVLPKIDPQKAGGLRTPLSILHPEPNSMGINEVYVTSIDGDAPTAKSGKTINIECLQWFPAPKPARVGKGTKVKGQNGEAFEAMRDYERAKEKAMDLASVAANRPTEENERAAREAAADFERTRRQLQNSGKLPNTEANSFAD